MTWVRSGGASLGALDRNLSLKCFSGRGFGIGVDFERRSGRGRLDQATPPPKSSGAQFGARESKQVQIRALRGHFRADGQATWASKLGRM